MAADILIVDDEADIRELVAGILEDEGYNARVAGDSDDRAGRRSSSAGPHLVLLDIWLQGSRLDGLQLLDIIKTHHPDLPVVMISGHGNIETAVTAIKQRRLRLHREAVQGRPAGAGRRARLEASRLKREVKELQEHDADRAARWSAPRRRSTSFAARSSAWRPPTAACSSSAPPAPARSWPPA